MRKYIRTRHSNDRYIGRAFTSEDTAFCDSSTWWYAGATRGASKLQQPTNPRINAVQNQEFSIRLLAAQCRLYSDAKVIHHLRLWIIIAGTVLGIAAGFAFPEGRTAIGLSCGCMLLLIGVLGSIREKRKTKDAASIQEELDTYLFQLSWNSILVDRPSITLIAEASRRYKGPRLEDWHPDTNHIPRPLDILVCQRSNLGWGTTLHQRWRFVLLATLLGTISILVILATVIRLQFVEFLASIFVPSLPLIRELLDQIRAHNDSAISKSSAEGKVLTLWRQGLDDLSKVSAADCRAIQDQILTYRQTHAPIPDWFNQIYHAASHESMIASADLLVKQAKERLG
ncbi:S-4TM family putative pore-forming effector [Actinocrispum sp. NPDC049592]|uniref:S-4TM family putative pore-forming effector n=1 Tax=Actinocrispum sp. NPDC049592 TaxID=3154835 RepID=UPI00343C8F8D